MSEMRKYLNILNEGVIGISSTKMPRNVTEVEVLQEAPRLLSDAELASEKAMAAEVKARGNRHVPGGDLAMAYEGCCESRQRLLDHIDALTAQLNQFKTGIDKLPGSKLPR